MAGLPPPSSDEYRSLTGVWRQRGYGTTPSSAECSLTPAAKGFVEHLVSRSDTLQSIAVKYSVTVAEIKRQNKLWNNESLSFRHSVQIPLYNIEDRDNVSVTSDGSVEHASTSKDSKSEPRQTASITNGLTTTNSSNTSTSDFFAKFDSSLKDLKAKVSLQVADADRILDIEEEDDVLFNSNDLHSNSASYQKYKPTRIKSKKGKGKQPAAHGHSTSSLSSLEELATHKTSIVSSEKSKSLKKTIEKHELRQEELFEL